MEKRQVLSHHEVLTRLDGYDPERGVKVVGHRGYFLKKWGVIFIPTKHKNGHRFSTRDFSNKMTSDLNSLSYLAPKNKVVFSNKFLHTLGWHSHADS